MPKPFKIAENKLLKAMAELEGVAKADPLEDADPEGGLSAEGEPLSQGAPRGKGDSTKKSTRRSSSSSSVDSSSDSESDDGEAASSMSFKKPPPAKRPGKVSKAVPPASSSSSSSSSDDDDSSSDDAGSDESTSKSFRQAVAEDNDVQEYLNVQPFLESLVVNISDSMARMTRLFKKSLQDTEQRLLAHIDDSIAKSLSGGTPQADFNVRLAKAVAAIGNTVQNELVTVQGDLLEMVKSISNQPVSPRGKAVLSKGEVNAPPWGGSFAVNADQRLASGSDGDYVEELKELSSDAIGDWLFKKSMNNQLDQRVIMQWEAERYNPEALPLQVRKAIANDLIK